MSVTLSPAFAFAALEVTLASAGRNRPGIGGRGRSASAAASAAASAGALLFRAEIIGDHTLVGCKDKRLFAVDLFDLIFSRRDGLGRGVQRDIGSGILSV